MPSRPPVAGMHVGPKRPWSPWRLDGPKPGSVRLGPEQNQTRNSPPRAWFRPGPRRTASGLDLFRPAWNRLGLGRAQTRNGPPRAGTYQHAKTPHCGPGPVEARIKRLRAWARPGPMQTGLYLAGSRPEAHPPWNWTNPGQGRTVPGLEIPAARRPAAGLDLSTREKESTQHMQYNTTNT